ncbi:MAG: hypothetical protein QOJ03_3098 [Frankiaceae bacterium]|nr:hypothetical protein [Frankiaceae bacterium]
MRLTEMRFWNFDATAPAVVPLRSGMSAHATSADS